jgi:hypothetical protein
MNARRARAADWRAIGAIRRLQSRAAEMEAVRAGREREEATKRQAESEAALAEAQDGWESALAGAFDPGLARHWAADVDRKQAASRAAERAANEAEARLDDKRTALNAADARAEVAEDRHRAAAGAVARHREEQRLAEIEDRASREAKRS